MFITSHARTRVHMHMHEWVNISGGKNFFTYCFMTKMKKVFIAKKSVQVNVYSTEGGAGSQQWLMYTLQGANWS